DGLKKYRKRVPLGRNFEALEFARSLGVHVAINLIADPDWDHERFRIVREWCLEQPEIVNISVNTPYPGTESWLTEERRLETRDRPAGAGAGRALYVHAPRGRAGRAIDAATEHFVDETRMGATP